jgi:hypothetical protein
MGMPPGLLQPRLSLPVSATLRAGCRFLRSGRMLPQRWGIRDHDGQRSHADNVPAGCLLQRVISLGGFRSLDREGCTPS